MSGNAAYEVQGYAGGVWRTLRVCGDADDAIAEAKGTRDNRKYLSVRVTAEIYNENSGKYISRTVYRHSQLTPAQKAAVQPPCRSASPSADRSRPRPQPQQQPRRPRPAYNASAELVESETIAGMLVWRLSLVALIGLSLVWGLQQFRQLL